MFQLLGSEHLPFSAKFRHKTNLLLDRPGTQELGHRFCRPDVTPPHGSAPCKLATSLVIWSNRTQIHKPFQTNGVMQPQSSTCFTVSANTTPYCWTTTARVPFSESWQAECWNLCRNFNRNLSWNVIHNTTPSWNGNSQCKVLIRILWFYWSFQTFEESTNLYGWALRAHPWTQRFCSARCLLPILVFTFLRIPKHDLYMSSKITKVALLSYYSFSQF